MHALKKMIPLNANHRSPSQAKSHNKRVIIFTTYNAAT
jgi:hypothetical protein